MPCHGTHKSNDSNSNHNNGTSKSNDSNTNKHNNNNNNNNSSSSSSSNNNNNNTVDGGGGVDGRDEIGVVDLLMSELNFLFLHAYLFLFFVRLFRQSFLRSFVCVFSQIKWQQ